MSGNKKQSQLTFNKIKGKENDKSVSPRVDPKKLKITQKKNAQINKKINEEEEKLNMNKKNNQKDGILDSLVTRGRKKSINHDQSSNSTPQKSQKKYNQSSNNMQDIESQCFQNINNIYQNSKNSLLKQQKNGNSSNKKNANEEIEIEEKSNLHQESEKGIKKPKKLVKISEKSEKIKANTKKPIKKQIEISSSSSSEEEISDEESEQGKVEYVDDEVDNLQKNKRVDQMLKSNQKKLDFQSAKKKEQQEQKQEINLQSFFTNQQPQDLSENLEKMRLNEQDECQEINSDEEEIKRIEQMQKQKKEQQEMIIIQDSPVKAPNQERKSVESQMEVEEIEQEQQDQDDRIIEIKSENFTPKNFKNQTFYFLGKLDKLDQKIINLIIERNEGKVVTQPGKSDGCFNVIGTNVDKFQLDRMKNKKFPIIYQQDFQKLIEDTLKVNMIDLVAQYKQIFESENSQKEITNQIKNQQEQQQKQQLLQQQQQQSQSQISRTSTHSQKVNLKSQKQEEKPQQKIQQQSQSALSGLASFLPTPINLIQQESEVYEPQYNQLTKSLSLNPEDNKNSNENQQSMTSSLPFFKKDKLQKKKSQVICIIDEEEPQKVIETNKSNEMDVEIEMEQPKKVKIPQKSSINHLTIQNRQPKEENYTHALWTHKYAPRQLDDCVGNETQIKKLENWLVNWENVVIHKQKVEGNWKENPNSRACLISGPPGIGKTSTVRLLAQKYNMNIIEWNASDVRNKNAIESIINPLKDNTVLNFKQEVSSQRSIILMDEVDGMSSGDIGGNQALMKIIKETKNPIFCVCNDRYSQKLRSLAGICFDVRFYKPNKGQIAKRLLEVCKKEGLKSEFNHLEFLAESVNNDIRQALNLLQMQSKKSKEISFRSLVIGLNSFKKDDQVSMSAFEAAKLLMTKTEFDRKKQISQKVDLFFLDYELVPMLIHENYLSTFQSKEYNKLNLSELESIANATSAMAESDLLQDSIRSQGNWSLLQNVGFLTSVYIPEQVCSKCNTFPQMSQYLGKFSSQRKTQRLIRQLRMQLSQNISGNRQAVQFDYVEPLMELMLNQLENNGKQGVDNVIQMMEYYNINPELLKEHFTLIPYNSNFDQRLKDVPTTIKTTLTKAYNKKFKDDVKPEKKTKKTQEQEHNIKYDDILGEIEEVEIDEDEEEQKEEDQEQETQTISQNKKQSKQVQQKSNINKKQQEAESKAQAAKNTKATKEIQNQVESKNSIKSFFTKDKK